MNYDTHTEAYRRDLRYAFNQIADTQKALPKHKEDDPAKWLDQFEIQDCIITPGQSDKYEYAHYLSVKRIAEDCTGNAGERVGYIYDWQRKGDILEERTEIWDLVDNFLLPFVVNQMALDFINKTRNNEE